MAKLSIRNLVRITGSHVLNLYVLPLNFSGSGKLGFGLQGLRTRAWAWSRSAWLVYLS